VLSPTINPAGQGIRSPDQAYLIGQARYATSSPGFADAVARAHGEHRRPRCLCQRDGVEMYIARLASPNEGFIVKRMPESGHLHAPYCPSYEPPAALSGLGQVLGSAILENPTTGQITLKLDFPLTKRPGRPMLPPAGSEHDSVKSDGSRLSLRGLLHYLWDQAGLTRWHPGFAGRRSWTTVRRHLLDAAEGKFARGDPLRMRLYIPEAFTVEQRDVLKARRLAHWSRTLPRLGQATERLVLIGEVKEIVPARYGYRAIVKHVPDHAFALDAPVYQRLERRFEAQLSLWGATDGLHMMAIATFFLNHAGVPTIDELSLMPVTNQWLSVDDAFDLQLTAQLVNEGRSFIKPLRYNLPPSEHLPAGLLIDCKDAPTAICIERASRHAVQGYSIVAHGALAGSPTWWWHASEEAMPPLPPAYHPAS
jgi:hypothetical protein